MLKRTKSLFIIFTLSFLIFNYSTLLSQVVYEPVGKDIYVYLERISQKGIIKFDDLIRPLSRKYLAEKLSEVNNKKFELTSLERDELEFYLKDFGRELEFWDKNKSTTNKQYSDFKTDSSKLNADSYLSFFSHDHYQRPRIFSYQDSLFSINVGLNLGYETGKRDGEKVSKIWSGINFYGYLSNNIGFSFSYSDFSETGRLKNQIYDITPEPGVVVLISKKNELQYSSINTSVTMDWSWGSFSLGKDYFQWGYGKSGQIVLSQKAPSFPYARLDINPTEWFRFNYFHGWLNSDVDDSTSFYPTNRDSVYREQYRSKFIASHTISLTPFRGFDINLGESIIYSDRMEIAYLIPIMFFRLADHYLSSNSNGSASNSQFFLNFSSRNHVPNTHLYATALIDEFKISDAFDSENQKTQYAFTLGSSTADFLVDNLTINVEYTKIYPFVYRNYIPTQTYENSSFVLGHWIEHNSDIVFGSLNYRVIRGLQFTVWGNYVRKGEDGTADDQYTTPQPPFLFGLRKNTTNYGISAKYEIFHDLFVKAKYQSTKLSEQSKDLSFTNKNYSEFLFSVNYGL